MAITESTKARIKLAHTARGGSDIRYRIICRHIKTDNRLCPKDYVFYMAYCIAHEIEPSVVIKESGIAAIPYDGRSDVAGMLKSTRYSKLITALNNGESISQADYGFLWKYCRANGLNMPWCRATYSLMKNK
jgi:hypothetical protein